MEKYNKVVDLKTFKPKDTNLTENELRVQLAAAYRIFNYLKWDYLIYGHITVRVPGPKKHFLINPFGLRYDEVTASNLVKIDINGNIGTKIYTPMSGKVIYEGFNKKLGNIIIISHNNGYITKYMHNKKNFVDIVQKVSVNEPIAEMGNSGSSVKSEGIHLHFELWQNGVAINPTPFIKKLQIIDSNTLVLESNVGVKNEIR